MTFIIIMVYLVIYCIQGSIWGWAVNKIIENKGYRENWFWWGFFFGIIALLVALTKQDMPRTTGASGNYFGDDDSTLGKDYVFRGFGYERKLTEVPGGWRCHYTALPAESRWKQILNFVGIAGQKQIMNEQKIGR